MLIPSTKYPYTLQFRGRKTTAEAALNHHTAAQLQTSLENDSDPYIGKIPEQLQAQGLPENRFREMLDILASQLRRRPNRHKSILKQLEEKNNITNPLPIRKIGEGRMGRVYKLGNSPDAFALKVFRNPGESIVEEGDLAKAPFRETANGLFLTHRNTKNVSRFNIANPFEGWTLTEYIGKRDQLAGRPGKTLMEQNLFLDDTGNDKNFVNGIRIDHGDHLSDQSKYASNVIWIG